MELERSLANLKALLDRGVVKGIFANSDEVVQLYNDLDQVARAAKAGDPAKPANNG